jgi:hypothetical protein
MKAGSAAKWSDRINSNPPCCLIDCEVKWSPS